MFSKPLNQKLITALVFVAVIAVNAAANALPINGFTTGELSDRNFNLFTPAGFTFSIWGVIYLALLGYILLIFRSNQFSSSELSFLWVVNGVANMGWIFAWHYLKIASSMFIMLILLLSLIWITDYLHKIKEPDRITLYVRAAFDVYFGWITVATIANATALLVAMDFGRWGLSEAEWTSTMVGVAATVALLVLLMRRSIWYLLPILWAFYGIYAKHQAEWGFRSAYPEVLNTLQFAFGLLIVMLLFTVYKKLASTSHA
ncbi:MAG: hypothetical protein VW236_00945 [Flavobacteriaceae bacterium]